MWAMEEQTIYSDKFTTKLSRLCTLLSFATSCILSQLHVEYSSKFDAVKKLFDDLKR